MHRNRHEVAFAETQLANPRQKPSKLNPHRSVGSTHDIALPSASLAGAAQLVCQRRSQESEDRIQNEGRTVLMGACAYLGSRHALMTEWPAYSDC
jgi:hypothetical protein